MTLDADYLWGTYRRAAATPISDPPDRIAGLRAVEAAVRADQIEKDAALARKWLADMHRDAPAKAFPDALEAAIRAQLQIGDSNE